ncbi:uncharacterized protein LACBIDRAFT_296144 [Laccaria bicolor S238N-H82]|uniref:Predicted protein n=1 Tax=Laccaria bicolor (strain S238N-H82 / ATCC MYA-4686) TaxID=486041 RepID=B0E1H0_LACBS|nr:uncharacterized protein LACBIDRAFT_316709 [Laccaria bicolor S238N-H82]XP_001890542.1 uncharacterized protein LACBIDRAFT_296144 [Laccaria bicolor S238N-H82]EDQ98812.1 predicted protein [Laccaria bicolor S238N-H82]EDQ99307.1 predicted protein [Laccaria bicolor S238N-H82]|eukprot:XP_001890027.1 predicted protein [Laccaria bicolor S238N-H82]
MKALIMHHESAMFHLLRFNRRGLGEVAMFDEARFWLVRNPSDAVIIDYANLELHSN